MSKILCESTGRGTVICTDEGVILKRYYFPTFKSKLVKWEDIERVERITCGLGNSKSWGMPMDGSWWHCSDFGREFKGGPGLIIHTAESRMGMSPKNIDEIERVIKQEVRKHR